MQKNRIIFISALIIGVFAALFILEKPNVPPKFEAKDLVNEYRGEPGFVILTLPRFMIDEVILNNKPDIKDRTKTVHAVRVMIFHEKENTNLSRSVINSRIDEGLKSLNFQILDQKNNPPKHQKIFYKPKEDDWNESVYIYSGDSSIFLFDIINNLTAPDIKSLADSIDTEGIKF